MKVLNVMSIGKMEIVTKMFFLSDRQRKIISDKVSYCFDDNLRPFIREVVDCIDSIEKSSCSIYYINMFGIYVPFVIDDKRTNKPYLLLKREIKQRFKEFKYFPSVYAHIIEIILDMFNFFTFETGYRVRYTFKEREFIYKKIVDEITKIIGNSRFDGYILKLLKYIMPYITFIERNGQCIFDCKDEKITIGQFIDHKIVKPLQIPYSRIHNIWSKIEDDFDYESTFVNMGTLFDAIMRRLPFVLCEDKNERSQIL